MKKKAFSKETLATVLGLRLIDDTFFRLVAEDKAACQEILRNLLDDDNLLVIKVTPQRRLGGLHRNIIVDVLCQLADGSYANIEVQTGDKNDDFRRMRLHSALITAAKTKKGTDFKDVPNVTILYIAEYDAAGLGQTVTPCYHYMKKGRRFVKVNDGETIIYATTAINDGSKHSKLLQLFLKEDCFNSKEFPALSRQVDYFKNTEKGREKMCATVEKLAEERADKREQEIMMNITSMQKKGVAADDIIKSILKDHKKKANK